MRLKQSDLERSIKAYGLGYSSTLAVQSGYRNTSHLLQLDDDSMANLIVYKKEPSIADRISRLNRLSKHLSPSMLPIRAPIDDRILKISSQGQDYFASLYNYLPGATIQWEAYSMKHIKLLGWALAEFHNHTTDYRGTLPNVATEYRQIVSVMNTYFSRADILSAMTQKLGVTLYTQLGELGRLIDRLDLLDDKQALHMDLVRGNILFDSSSPEYQLQIDSVAISGIIDLEKTSYGHPVWDIGRSLAFLLVDCPKPQYKIIKYFIDSGYIKRGSRNLDTALLGGLVQLYLLYDFYKFLRDNPYESLLQNHHFIRTRDILIEQNMLHYR